MASCAMTWFIIFALIRGCECAPKKIVVQNIDSTTRRTETLFETSFSEFRELIAEIEFSPSSDEASASSAQSSGEQCKDMYTFWKLLDLYSKVRQKGNEQKAAETDGSEPGGEKKQEEFDLNAMD